MSGTSKSLQEFLNQFNRNPELEKYQFHKHTKHIIDGEEVEVTLPRAIPVNPEEVLFQRCPGYSADQDESVR